MTNMRLKSEKEKATKTKMAAIMFAVALVVTVLAAGAMTLTATQAVNIRTSFRSVHFLGKGIAVNPANPLQDVHIITMGAADVEVDEDNNVTNVSLGVLNLQNSSYLLKNLAIGDGTVKGDVFMRPYSNGTDVGGFNVSLLGRATGDLWTGTLTINGQTWNVYLLEGKRKQTPEEEKNSVGEYCSTHPTDGTCRRGIENFCESNPQNERCVELMQKFCKTHLGDATCRQALRDFCTKHADNDKCETYCRRFPAICGQPTTGTSTSTQTETETQTSSSSTSSTSSTSSSSSSTTLTTSSTVTTGSSSTTTSSTTTTTSAATTTTTSSG